MKKLLSILFFCCSCANNITQDNNGTDAKLWIKFSPHGGCTEQINKSIDKAQKRVWVQAYSFTSLPIGEKLIAAKERNVDVQIILDRANEGNPDSLLPLMLEHGVKVYIDSAHAIAHNKVMVIDDKYVNTGSFNFTKSAEQKNAENCILIESKDINVEYADNWLRHKEHSKEY